MGRELALHTARFDFWHYIWLPEQALITALYASKTRTKTKTLLLSYGGKKKVRMIQKACLKPGEEAARSGE